MSKENVRDLAREGRLVQYAATASAEERRSLRAAVYEIAMPVVFQNRTRRLELERGHRACASSPNRLEPACYDRFTDAVEAVVDYVLERADARIENLEGWVTSRIGPATIDRHRKRRGERGAMQRPRLPKWLVVRLGEDDDLAAVAVDILGWAGVEATAGADLWPYGAWAAQRAQRGGSGDEAGVRRDVEIVLRAMRTRPAWYERYVERPLGRKQSPLLPARQSEPGEAPELPGLELVPRHEREDAGLLRLATMAVDQIEARLRRGEPVQAAVAEVLRRLFGEDVDAAADMDQRPGTEAAGAERTRRMLADPEQLERIADAVIAALGLDRR
jgi:hypothetical protein